MAKTREEKLAHAQAALTKSNARCKNLHEAPTEDDDALLGAKILVENDKIRKLEARIAKLSAPVISPEARKEIRILQNAVEILKKYTAPATTTNHLLVLVGEIQKVTA